MYLSLIKIENFRQFSLLELEFQRGLNLLVGENDSGKSTILDAIKLVTGTHSNDWMRLDKEDFHKSATSQSAELKIMCRFSDLTTDEAAAFLEWLSIADGKYYLKLTLTGRRKQKSNSISEVFYDIKAGEDEESGVMAGEAKSKLKVNYLKALRDAEYELAPRKGSRLSQILAAHEKFQKKDDSRHELEVAMDKANVEIRDYFENQDGKVVSDTINEDYLKAFSLANNPLTAQFGISSSDLGRILEKLELSGLSRTNDSNLGLGSSNLLFIAAELLLLKTDLGYVGLKLALVEEIEAHLHPQSQLNLIDFLDKHSVDLGFQCIITTHSNSLASKADLNNLIVCKGGSAFPLKSGLTKLALGDYKFLRRFLDDTKSNLFFANGVMIVEGDAENLLIPTLADKIGMPLHKNGISIVNVRSIGLFRYARIFQRADGTGIGIRVACVTDRDIPPKAAGEYTYPVKTRGTNVARQKRLLKANRKTEDQYTQTQIDQIVSAKVAKYDGGEVKVYVPTTWTLEFELAKSCLRDLIHKAILIAIATKNLENDVTNSIIRKQFWKVCKQNERWEADGKDENQIAVEIYAPLERKQASKAVVAQLFSWLLSRSRIDPATIKSDPFLKYIVDAIQYVAHV